MLTETFNNFLKSFPFCHFIFINRAKITGFYFITICCHNRNTTLRNNRNKTQQNIKNKTEQPLPGQPGNKRSPSNSLGAIARGFESAVTKQINVLRNTPGESIWQKNINDHIIRDKQEYFRIKTYIKNNPVNWDDDEMNK